MNRAVIVAVGMIGLEIFVTIIVGSIIFETLISVNKTRITNVDATISTNHLKMIIVTKSTNVMTIKINVIDKIVAVDVLKFSIVNQYVVSVF